LAAGLFIAAIWSISRSGLDVPTILKRIGDSPTHVVVALIFLPLVNLAISASVFWILIRRFGKVTFSEMLMLIGASWLLNYLPLKPGIWGRVAYHRAINGIAVRHSAQVVVESMACSAIASILAMFWSVLLAKFQDGHALFLWIPPILMPTVLGCGLLLRRRYPYSSALVCALSLRGMDLIIWSLRYWAVLAVVGSPITLAQAAALAAVSQVAMAIPLSGNGLGLREWAVGFLRASLPVWYGSQAPAVEGLTADVVQRTIEVLLALPIGLFSGIVLLGRWRRLHRAGGSPAPNEDAGTLKSIHSPSENV
jgi:hypothetical protein